MMKRLVICLLLAATLLSLCACGECKHEWARATCTEPQYCTKCGLSNGAPLGHDYVGGVCSRCGAANASASQAAEPAASASYTEASAPALSPKESLRAEHEAKMKAQSSELYVPDASYFLDEPVEKTVVPPGGSYIYSLYRPEDSENARIENLNRGTVVTIIAKQNGFALFRTDGGFYAWADDRWIVNSDDAPYIMWGNAGTAKEMVVSHKHKIYVCYTPYRIWDHFGVLSPGDKVLAYRTVNGFAFIECGATKGWVKASYLSER